MIRGQTVNRVIEWGVDESRLVWVDLRGMKGLVTRVITSEVNPNRSRGWEMSSEGESGNLSLSTMERSIFREYSIPEPIPKLVFDAWRK